MRQNIRIDIIYYQSDSDFEMEFNLNGCCPVRMLTSKAEEKGALVKYLARAVSRSKVIICCGNLFGDDGLTRLVSTAIGSGTERVSCEEYGITSAANIEVISGALPLVTPDGYFGGCIIESGPQTIILLSENRLARKSIMNNLIHPYLEDVSLRPEEVIVPKRVQEAEEEENEVVDVPVIDEEQAAADAAAIVAAALSEGAAATAAKEIIDISSISAVDEVENIADAKINLSDSEPPEDISEEVEPEQELELPSEEAELQETEEFEQEPQETVVIEQEPQDAQEAEQDPHEQTEETEQPETKTEPTFVAKLEVLPPDAIIEPPVNEADELFVSTTDSSDIVPSEEDFLEKDIDTPEMFIEPRSVRASDIDAYARNYVPSDSDQMFLSDDEDYAFEGERPENKAANLSKPIIVLAILLALILVVLGYVLIAVPYMNGQDFEQYISELFAPTATQALLKWF